MNKQAFTEWLEQQQDNWSAASGAPCACPLARYLQDTIGGIPAVGVDNYSTGPHLAERTYAAMPYWATAFVQMVDNRPTWSQISKQTCLSIIRNIGETA